MKHDQSNHKTTIAFTFDIGNDVIGRVIKAGMFTFKWMIILLVIFTVAGMISPFIDKIRYGDSIRQCVSREYDGYIGIDFEFGYCYKWGETGERLVIDKVMFAKMQEEIAERMNKIN